MKTITDEQMQKRKFWKRHIEEWRGTGSRQAEYCRQHKLSAKSFTYWKGIFREKSAVSFVPVEVKPEAQMADISSGLVLCKDGYRIEIKEDFKPEALGKVLRIIRELQC
ncbi:MAG: hypothetical protein HY809_10890 [Nitrospirae bacterium]|nr:hypothetical protein [Nitrospirota bacterium]